MIVSRRISKLRGLSTATSSWRAPETRTPSTRFEWTRQRAARSIGHGDDIWLAALTDDESATFATTHLDGLGTDGGYGAVPGEVFALRDDYQIYPNGSATSTSVGTLGVNAHSGNIFVSDVKDRITVQPTVPSRTPVYP